MDYEKKYKEALEKARQLCAYPTTKPFISDLQDLFPELKESEDERIRKELIDFVKSRLAGFHDCKRFTDWLEKQGEQKPVFEMKTPEESLGIDYDTYNKIVDECVYGEQKPADLPKGEDYGIDGLYAAIDILQKTLGEVDGYQSDDGILTHKCAISAVKELSKQNPAWSEKDKKMHDFAIRTIGLCKQYAINHQVNGYSNLPDVPKKYEELQDWLISLKPQFTWKPSDEQIDALEDAIADAVSSIQKNMLNSLYNDLIKLK